jgi:hypothetical protein
MGTPKVDICKKDSCTCFCYVKEAELSERILIAVVHAGSLKVTAHKGALVIA